MAVGDGKHENTIASRIAINQFIDLLTGVTTKYKLTVEEIWNFEEIEISIVSKEDKKKRAKGKSNEIYTAHGYIRWM